MPQRRSARRWWPAMLVAGLALLGIAGGVATELLGGLVPDVWVQENRGLVIGSFAVIGLAGIMMSLLLWRAERPVAEPPPDPAGPGSTGVGATVEVGHNVGEVAGIKAGAVMQADHGAQVGQQQTAGRDLGTAQTHGQAAPAIGINYGHITIQDPPEAPSLAAGPAAVADRSDRGSGQPPALVVGALPPYPPHFVGRTDLLDRLHQQFTATQGQPTAIVAAHGLGGIGKTALAVAYAYHHHTDYELIGWIPADTPLTIAAGLAALAPPLGVTVVPDQEETVAAVLAELRRRDRWLLLFDNADDPADLLGRLPTGGRGRILVTSRNPTWADLAHRLEVEVLDPAAAAELLLTRTGNTDEGAARSVAEALGWLPLALQQAGAYIAATPGCTLAGYLARYEQVRTALLAQHLPVGYPESGGHHLATQL